MCKEGIMDCHGFCSKTHANPDFMCYPLPWVETHGYSYVAPLGLKYDDLLGLPDTSFFFLNLCVGSNKSSIGLRSILYLGSIIPFDDMLDTIFCDCCNRQKWIDSDSSWNERSIQNI